MGIRRSCIRGHQDKRVPLPNFYIRRPRLHVKYNRTDVPSCYKLFLIFF